MKSIGKPTLADWTNGCGKIGWVAMELDIELALLHSAGERLWLRKCPRSGG